VNKILMLFVCISLVLPLELVAGHIGKTKIKRIRSVSASKIIVWLDRDITSPPACATVSNKIAFTDIDTEWGKRKLSMLMAAMAANYSVDPNCTSLCATNWDGYITLCGEASIEK